MLVLLFCNLIFGSYGFFNNLIHQPNMNISFYFAKAGGGMLNFNCAVIFLPVCRNMLSWLRTTPIAKIIPMDDNILFHKFIGFLIFLTAGLHIVMHYFNFWAIAQDRTLKKLEKKKNENLVILCCHI
jgi:hypothetical protein